MFSLFHPKPLLETESIDWIFDTYLWALEHFDHNEFFHNTQLIQPTNTYFPGKVNSLHEMAESIFNHTAKYCGVSHWPFNVVPPEDFRQCAIPNLNVSRIQRDSKTELNPIALSNEINKHAEIIVSYNPQQTSRPGDLSASFAHIIAQHMVQQSKTLPPGGAELIIPATEILAIFMGFGVLFANSAYTFRGGCGSCFNPNANRKAVLKEDEVTFAFALFCKIKHIPRSESTRHLKKYLIGNFKRAEKQIENEKDRLDVLLTYCGQ